MNRDELIAYSASWLPADVMGDLLAMWSAPGRFYHNETHLFSMILDVADMADMFRMPSFDIRELVVAAWFHDAVYVAGAKDNEAQSAKLATEAICKDNVGTYDQIMARSLYAMRVANDIMKTVDHLHPETFVQACLLDADLAGLGRNYKINGDNIRREYSMYDDCEFAAGRIAFLESMLDRPHIYYTAWGHQFENCARASIQADLEMNRKFLVSQQ